MKYEQLSRQFFNLIGKAKNILVVSHQKPDGDTLGANFALLHYLEKYNKFYKSFCLHEAPREFLFLPLSYKLSNNHDVFRENYDLIIVLDSGDLRYAGVEEEFRNLSGDFTIINIDHHPTNEYFGDLNIVDPLAASTTEIIYNLFFYRHNFKIDKNIATCLLTGICTDTSNFSNPATSQAALQISSALLVHGANFQIILKNILQGQSISILKLWGRALSRLQLNDLGIAVTVITKKDLAEENLDEEAVSGVANFLNNLHGVKAVLVLKEEGGEHVRGSLRTSSENIDVSRLAKFFGGGGHKKAAGFSIPGRLVCDKGGCWRVK